MSGLLSKMVSSSSLASPNLASLMTKTISKNPLFVSFPTKFQLLSTFLKQQQRDPKSFSDKLFRNFDKFKSSYNTIQTRSYVRSYFENESRLNTKKVSNLFKSPSQNRSNQTQSSKTPPPIENKEVVTNAQPSGSIFQRFKEAYKQHGITLIVCHATLSFGFVTGFYFLSKSGFQISSIFHVLELLHIMTPETSASIVSSIHNFNLQNFLHNYHFDSVFSDSQIEWLGKQITGVTLNHLITAIMLYKISAPLRYLTTLGVTKLVISQLQRSGIIAAKPPPGLSIREIAKDQTSNVRSTIRSMKNKAEQRIKAKRRSATKGVNNKPPKS